MKNHTTKKIDDEIVVEINKSRFLIADFTGHRGGVYWEAGYATALGIPVIHCCNGSDFDNAHFNIRQYNHIVYDNTLALKEQLQARIARMLVSPTA
ncbi:MAG: hypothetical protein IPJ88_18070 [Myxococcales bacterium]|nr:MAG: hypothetical protein IPJ88_18070 [Myxococcales bacterium]